MGVFKDEGGDRVIGGNSVNLCEGNECEGLWKVVNGSGVSVVVGCVGLLFEMPWDEGCWIGMVIADVL